mmetsp:Transcript_18256/g.46383  ORF Transcript_18256/g.46383 Transcript_18256/m.46383 type:complete len:136 (-) Transcript_18256:142-549(-)
MDDRFGDDSFVDDLGGSGNNGFGRSGGDDDDDDDEGSVRGRGDSDDSDLESDEGRRRSRKRRFSDARHGGRRSAGGARNASGGMRNSRGDTTGTKVPRLLGAAAGARGLCDRGAPPAPWTMTTAPVRLKPTHRGA